MVLLMYRRKSLDSYKPFFPYSRLRVVAPFELNDYRLLPDFKIGRIVADDIVLSTYIAYYWINKDDVQDWADEHYPEWCWWAVDAFDFEPILS